MIPGWQNYLAVHLYLAPNDENRVRYLMNLVPEYESNGDANVAKNLAVSAAIEQFLPCWMCRKFGNVYLGVHGDYREFDYRRYDPRTDPLYSQENAPNFRCALIVQDITRCFLFFPPEAYDGTTEQLIILAVRVQAFRKKKEERGKPNLWMTDSRYGPVPFIPSFIMESCPRPKKED